jgi:outer membrane PBP1 activator LpoA protein
MVRPEANMTRILAAIVTALCLAGCVTVKPSQRSVLADPIMQFEGDPQASAQLRHAIDNREGSYGGAGVAGGGCGCN